jgi:large subunit ribosomal protein L25
MPEIVVAAESRDEFGKNVNRRLRAAGRIPGVVYGSGKKAEHVTVSPKELAGILRSASGENSLIDLEVDGKRRKVIVKDYVVDPIKGKLLHADFYEVAMDKPLHLPVHVELQGTAVGVKLGGQLDFVTRMIDVTCLPADIPRSWSSTSRA